MQKLMPWLIAALFVAGTSVIAVFAESRQQSVYDLSGFVTSEGVPEGWYRFAEPPDGYQMSVTDEGYGGGKALVVDGDAQYGGAAGQHISLDRDRRYIASGWVKIDAEPGATASVKIDYYDGSGQYLADTMAGPITAGTSGWQPLSIVDQADQHPEAREVALTFLMTGKGKAWFSQPALHSRPREKVADLLENGRVEIVSGANEVPGWTLSHDQSGMVSIQPSTDNPHDGRFALRMKGDSIEWATASPGGGLTVDRNKKYTLSGYARAQGGEASLAIVYLGDGDQYLGHSSSDAVTDNHWQELQVTSELDEYPQATRIRAGAFGSGAIDAWYDTLSLTAE